jgi:hypothetical protein
MFSKNLFLRLEGRFNSNPKLNSVMFDRTVGICQSVHMMSEVGETQQESSSP